MIRRERKPEDRPEELTSPTGVGQRELAKVIAWMTGKGSKPTFGAYKAPGVVIALERMFQGKCAYCESLYNRTQPVDIEHWRPKGGAKDEEGGVGPGYPWLAMEWENLLPSCIDCNRYRKQRVLRPAGNGTFAWETIGQGKGNQFPLEDEKMRVLSYSMSLAQEVPLLVNPCMDDPLEFFHYDENGVVLPKEEKPTDPAGKQRRLRALASIDVYALNRKGLVDERKERILLLRARFGLITSLVKLEAGSKDKATRALANALIESEIGQLVALSEFRQPYALMTKQFVYDFLDDLKRP